MKNLYCLIFIIIGFGINSKVSAALCETQSAGNWSAIATWTDCNSSTPQLTDDVNILHAVSFDTDATVQSIVFGGSGDFDVAAGSSTLIVTSSDIDLSGVDVTLLGDLTLETSGRDIILDVINGDFDLTLNSDDETVFTGSNSSTTITTLKSLTTDSQGSIVIKGIRNLILTGGSGSIFNDAIVLGTAGQIKGELSVELTGLGGLIFEQTISSIGNREHYLQLTSNAGEITFNSSVSVGDLTTNGSANTIMNGLQITTAAGEYNTGHMLFNSPVIIAEDMVFEVASFSGDITFASTINDDGDANTDADVVVNGPEETNFGGVVGGINPISSLNTDSDGVTHLFASINVFDDVVFNDATEINSIISINAAIVHFLNDVSLAEAVLTINSSNAINSKVMGVMSGVGGFVKEGVSEIEFGSVNTFTGNLTLNDGTLTNTNDSENIFPSVVVFSLASSTQASFASATTDIFELTAGQSIIGSGYIPNIVDRQQNEVVNISPGFSPGQLTFDRLYVDEFAILTFELNGTTAGTDYDQIIILEKIQLEYDLENGTTLDVSLGFTPSIGDVFRIVDNQSAAPIGDTFIDLAEDGEIVIGDVTLVISYIGGTGGNDITLTVSQSPVTIYVDIDANNGAGIGDGTSWETAYNSLHDGLNAALDGDQVWVAEGIYYPGVDSSDPLSVFTLINGVKLYGGFNATETELSQRDSVANLTIVSGDLGDDDSNKINGVTTSYSNLVGTNSFHLIKSFDTDDTTLIDGFTLTAGWAAGGVNSDRRGAAVNCNNSSLKMNNLIVQGNRSNDRAALWSCSSAISNASFVNNFAGDVAGVSATGGAYTDVVFYGNVAGIQGSLFYLGGGSLDLTRVKIIGNGGNSASIIRAQNAMLNFNEVLFSGNQYENGVLDLSGNTYGTLNNVTLTGNKNILGGAGIKSTISGANSLDINNSILWNNQNSTGTGILDASITHNGAGVVNLASSILQGSGGSIAWTSTSLVDGGGNLDEDPLFVADVVLANVPTSLGDAHLTDMSIAIDTGDNSFVTSTTDLDGRARIFSGTVDMGAYEYFEEQVFKDGFE